MRPYVQYKLADASDVPAMARIRAADWGSAEYWNARISGYLNGELHPQQALAQRTIYVAWEGNSIVGFIAGHLTRRHDCHGELEWINVIPERRGRSVASELLRRLARWFVEQGATRICVDVDPENTIARRFYTRHGPVTLNPHWLIWNNIQSLADKQ